MGGDDTNISQATRTPPDATDMTEDTGITEAAEVTEAATTDNTEATDINEATDITEIPSRCGAQHIELSSYRIYSHTNIRRALTPSTTNTSTYRALKTRYPNTSD